MKTFVSFPVIGLLLALVVVLQPAAWGDKPRDGQPGASVPIKSAPTKPASATGPAAGQSQATPVERIRVAKDFRVERLYSVPADQQGSWVNLCLDSQGRILTSDQFGGLFRIVPPPAGKPVDPSTIEKVPAKVRGVNGMVWAFDALYVVVNDYERRMECGLYRVTDSDGDDQLDKVELLRPMINGNGDHGVHALVPTPDGKALYWITGNQTKLAEYTSTRVPRCWGEDHLLPRMPDSRGFMRGVLAPGGIIYRVSPDGRQCEVVSSGYRNIFDAALNRDGELFTYDADMEDDMNASWYRPTRVCHVTSGSEYGWRNGAGKRPEWYPDNLPPVMNIGFGSPTGMTFGYGANFPAKYQEALFILDWSWGNIFAVHVQPNGSTYTATKEDFLSGMPLPVTDAIIHPADGAMYFTIGGRRVQSGLYRVTYVGKESTAPVKPARRWAGRSRPAATLGSLSRSSGSSGGVRSLALSGTSRPLRSLGGTDCAVEHQPAATWTDRVFAETNSTARLEALLGLARVTAIDPLHRRATDPPNDMQMQARILSALLKIDWNALADDDRLTLMRTYQICFNRGGRPDGAFAERVVAQLDPHFPAPTFPLNWMLCETLVYLQAPTAAAKSMALLESSPSQEEQIEYARSLRMLKAGWTLPLRIGYLNWFLKAANYRGGGSFEKYVEMIRTEALATLSDSEKASLAELLARKPQRKSPLEGMAELFKGRTPRNWTLYELAAAAQAGLKQRNYEQGRKMFAAALCYNCHRFRNSGGLTGPDLSAPVVVIPRGLPRPDHQPQQSDQRAVRADGHHHGRRGSGHRDDRQRQWRRDHGQYRRHRLLEANQGRPTIDREHGAFEGLAHADQLAEPIDAGRNSRPDGLCSLGRQQPGRSVSEMMALQKWQ